MKIRILFFLLSLFAIQPSFAETVAEIKTSGTIMKDTLSVNAVDDLGGIVCYVTSVEIGGFNWENPTDSAIACRQVGPIIGKVGNKEEVFSQSKNLFFKAMKVDRVYDAKRNVILYVSYVRKMSGSNAAHSISVVPLSHPLKP